MTDQSNRWSEEVAARSVFNRLLDEAVTSERTFDVGGDEEKARVIEVQAEMRAALAAWEKYDTNTDLICDCFIGYGPRYRAVAGGPREHLDDCPAENMAKALRKALTT